MEEAVMKTLSIGRSVARAARIGAVVALFVALMSGTAGAVMQDSEPEPEDFICSTVCTVWSSCTKSCLVITSGGMTGSTCGAYGKCYTPPPPSEADVPDDADYACILGTSGTTSYFAKTGVSDKLYGITDAGVRQRAYASLVAMSASLAGTSGTKMTAQAYLKMWATLFGLEKEIVNLFANGTSIYGDSATGNFGAYFIGQKVLYGTMNVPLSTSKKWTKTFFDKGKTFWVGPFPVSVEGSIKGWVQLLLAGGPEMDGVRVGFEPSGGIDGVLKAYVGAFGAGAGVKGTLNVIDVETPVAAGLVRKSSGAVGLALEVGVDLSALAGKVEVFVDYLFDTWTKKIFDWSGFSLHYTVIDTSQCKAVP
jgi:hypothetical protein